MLFSLNRLSGLIQSLSCDVRQLCVCVCAIAYIGIHLNVFLVLPFNSFPGLLVFVNRPTVYNGGGRGGGSVAKAVGITKTNDR